MDLAKLMPGGAKAGSASGAEMMLRSLGLGEMIDFAKGLAESGMVENIVKFSEGIDELNSRLGRIEHRLIALGGSAEHGERTDDGASCLQFGGQLDAAAAFIQSGGAASAAPANVGDVRPSEGHAADSPASGGLAELRDVGLSDGSAAGGSSGVGDACASDGARGSRRSRAAGSNRGEK